MSRADQAIEYHHMGYNCAQSVVLAFERESGLTQAQAARLSAGLGGGVGQLREICGAVTGMTIVLGLLQAESEPSPENKRAIYQATRNIAERFERGAGSMRCGELLGLSGRDEPFPPADKRPCDMLIRSAVGFLEEVLDASNNGA
ncbi:MAG: C-GCAxxG-C-C family protein [Oscillospiraceae bacterium]|jgi:C_GCAxxG_C_C family probable redox protein|nr:C-GCAxxG-C-C family protein [Oscillospiraceae bacterium]